MNDTASNALCEELRDLEYAEGYAESFLNSYVATQLKVLREQRGMTQSDLAGLMGTTQTAISRAEDVNYSSWNIGTLKRFARAFEVRLHVSFETFGSLLDGMDNFNRKSLMREEHSKDAIIFAAARSPQTERAFAVSAMPRSNTSAQEPRNPLEEVARCRERLASLVGMASPQPVFAMASEQADLIGQQCAVGGRQ